MVGVLACHSYPALHTLLQKVVEQLASLGPPSAIVAVTTVLDTYQFRLYTASVIRLSFSGQIQIEPF